MSWFSFSWPSFLSCSCASWCSGSESGIDEDEGGEQRVVSEGVYRGGSLADGDEVPYLAGRVNHSMPPYSKKKMGVSKMEADVGRIAAEAWSDQLVWRSEWGKVVTPREHQLRRLNLGGDSSVKESPAGPIPRGLVTPERSNLSRLSVADERETLSLRIIDLLRSQAPSPVRMRAFQCAQSPEAPMNQAGLPEVDGRDESLSSREWTIAVIQGRGFQALEAQLRATQAQLGKVTGKLERMMALAHDAKGILRSQGQYCHFLRQEGKGNGEMEALISEVEIGSQDAVSLLEEAQQCYKGGGALLQNRDEETDLVSLLKGIFKGYVQRFVRKGCFFTLSVRLSNKQRFDFTLLDSDLGELNSLGLHIRTHRLLLRRVITNYLDNSLKYMPEINPRVNICFSITPSEEQTSLRIEVLTNSQRLKGKRVYEKIWERGCRLDDGGELEGHGQGLYNTREIAAQLGASVGAHYQEGGIDGLNEEGNLFWFHGSFESGSKENKERIAPKKAVSLSLSKETFAKIAPLKVLIVEDGNATGTIMKRILSRQFKISERQIFWAKHQEEALQYYRKEGPFDVVFMDLSFPRSEKADTEEGKAGIICTQQMREIDKSASAFARSPSYIVLRNADSFDALKWKACQRSGMNAHCVGEISSTRLLEQLVQAADRRVTNKEKLKAPLGLT